MNKVLVHSGENFIFFFLFLIERFCSLKNALAHIVLCRNDSRRISVGVAVYNLCSRVEQALGIFYLVAIQNQHDAFLVANPHTSHISSMYFRHFFKVCGEFLHQVNWLVLQVKQLYPILLLLPLIMDKPLCQVNEI